MSVENNSEKISKIELVAEKQVINSHHLERQIEELRDQVSRIEREWLQWKADVSLLSNNKDTNRQKEQLCNGQLLQNKDQFKKNIQPFIVRVTRQSDEIDQHISQQEKQQEKQQVTLNESQTSVNLEIVIDKRSNDMTVGTSELHKCSPSLPSFEGYFQDFFFNRYKNEYDPVLLFARMLFGILAFLAVIIEIIVFCNIGSDSKGLKFLFGLTLLFYEIAMMVYASGAAIYGAVFEAWIFVTLAIVNCILARCVWDCEDKSRKQASILWIVKVVFFATCTELTHQNFYKLENYKNAVKKSSRYILRQTLLFTLTILILIAPGLRTLYQSVYLPSSDCYYRQVSCGTVELYKPKFNASDPCESGFVVYVAAREEMRIIRNFIYFHIAFYSMFNKPFLDISFDLTYADLFRFLMLTGSLFLTVSYMWSNIDPFGFVNIPKLYIFDIIEIALVLLIFIMLSINLSKWKSKLKQNIRGVSWLCCTTINGQEIVPIEEESKSMVEYPTILYSFC